MSGISGIGFTNSFALGPVTGAYTTPVSAVRAVKAVSANEKSEGIDKVSKGECQTCKNRKYMDGSNDGNVSFKAPGHIDPAASGATVMAHEQEHVANARSEGSKEGNELVSVSVSLKMAVCPECGRSYVAGGNTRTTMKYNVSNPYEKNKKSFEQALLTGMNFNSQA